MWSTILFLVISAAAVIFFALWVLSQLKQAKALLTPTAPPRQGIPVNGNGIPNGGAGIPLTDYV